MLVGQQLGPFLIEKEIGAGAMGAVYRGKYVKTGQVVAVKVMAPGLGTTRANSMARFEREAEILKELRHPNIVRLFGIGKHQGTPYYAMEYIQGESLDRVMARRGRMSWEEVVDLGIQLCGALQHAHEHGIVHRDLKPSNLMILPDGTLKLTDFGIAKDLDDTGLTGTNATIGTASYMSPEQCKGDRNLTHKSDLYSLGVVLYELITGNKPFAAENAMDLFLLHINGPFERPSRMVLDMPVWLDNLICQLLEKKPEHRPRDAATVLLALESIQEKVEAQQSAGVDVARARRGDLPRDRRNATAEDKAAARALLRKKALKPKAKPLHERVWFRALGILLLLAVFITLLVVAFRPESADRLYRRAEKLMASENPEDWDRARDTLVKEYLQRFGKQNDARTEKVRKWAEDYDARRFEDVLDRHVRHVKFQRGLAVEANTGAEKLAFKAAEAEHDGDLQSAARLWKQAREEDGQGRVGLVAGRHLALFEAIDAQHKQLEALRQEVRQFRTEPQLEPLPGLAFLAVRQEKLGDRAGARRRYEQLREAAGKEGPAQRFWSLFAADASRRLKESLTAKPQEDKARITLIQGVVEKLQKALGQPDAALLDLRATAQDVAILYEKDPDFAGAAAQARKLVGQLDVRLPRPGKR